MPVTQFDHEPVQDVPAIMQPTQKPYDPNEFLNLGTQPKGFGFTPAPRPQLELPAVPQLPTFMRPEDRLSWAQRHYAADYVPTGVLTGVALSNAVPQDMHTFVSWLAREWDIPPQMIGLEPWGVSGQSYVLNTPSGNFFLTAQQADTLMKAYEPEAIRNYLAPLLDSEGNYPVAAARKYGEKLMGDALITPAEISRVVKSFLSSIDKKQVGFEDTLGTAASVAAVLSGKSLSGVAQVFGGVKAAKDSGFDLANMPADQLTEEAFQERLDIFEQNMRAMGEIQMDWKMKVAVAEASAWRGVRFRTPEDATLFFSPNDQMTKENLRQLEIAQGVRYKNGTPYVYNAIENRWYPISKQQANEIEQGFAQAGQNLLFPQPGGQTLPQSAFNLIPLAQDVQAETPTVYGGAKLFEPGSRATVMAAGFFTPGFYKMDANRPKDYYKQSLLMAAEADARQAAKDNSIVSLAINSALEATGSAYNHFWGAVTAVAGAVASAPSGGENFDAYLDIAGEVARGEENVGNIVGTGLLEMTGRGNSERFHYAAGIVALTTNLISYEVDPLVSLSRGVKLVRGLHDVELGFKSFHQMTTAEKLSAMFGLETSSMHDLTAAQRVEKVMDVFTKPHAALDGKTLEDLIYNTVVNNGDVFTESNLWFKSRRAGQALTPEVATVFETAINMGMKAGFSEERIRNIMRQVYLSAFGAQPLDHSFFTALMNEVSHTNALKKAAEAENLAAIYKSFPSSFVFAGTAEPRVFITGNDGVSRIVKPLEAVQERIDNDLAALWEQMDNLDMTLANVPALQHDLPYASHVTRALATPIREGAAAETRGGRAADAVLFNRVPRARMDFKTDKFWKYPGSYFRRARSATLNREVDSWISEAARLMASGSPIDKVLFAERMQRRVWQEVAIHEHGLSQDVADEIYKQLTKELDKLNGNRYRAYGVTMERGPAGEVLTRTFRQNPVALDQIADGWYTIDPIIMKKVAARAKGIMETRQSRLREILHLAHGNLPDEAVIARALEKQRQSLVKGILQELNVTWKALQVIRGGYLFRVLPDEFMRGLSDLGVKSRLLSSRTWGRLSRFGVEHGVLPEGWVKRVRSFKNLDGTISQFDEYIPGLLPYEAYADSTNAFHIGQTFGDELRAAHRHMESAGYGVLEPYKLGNKPNRLYWDDPFTGRPGAWSRAVNETLAQSVPHRMALEDIANAKSVDESVQRITKFLTETSPGRRLTAQMGIDLSDPEQLIGFIDYVENQVVRMTRQYVMSNPAVASAALRGAADPRVLETMVRLVREQVEIPKAKPLLDSSPLFSPKIVGDTGVSPLRVTSEKIVRNALGDRESFHRVAIEAERFRAKATFLPEPVLVDIARFRSADFPKPAVLDLEWQQLPGGRQRIIAWHFSRKSPYATEEFTGKKEDLTGPFHMGSARAAAERGNVSESTSHAVLGSQYYEAGSLYPYDFEAKIYGLGPGEFPLGDPGTNWGYRTPPTEFSQLNHLIRLDDAWDHVNGRLKTIRAYSMDKIQKEFDAYRSQMRDAFNKANGVVAGPSTLEDQMKLWEPWQRAQYKDLDGILFSLGYMRPDKFLSELGYDGVSYINDVESVGSTSVELWNHDVLKSGNGIRTDLRTFDTPPQVIATKLTNGYEFKIEVPSSEVGSEVGRAGQIKNKMHQSGGTFRTSNPVPMADNFDNTVIAYLDVQENFGMKSMGLWVHPHYEGTGLATQLVDAARQFYTPDELISLADSGGLTASGHALYRYLLEREADNLLDSLVGRSGIVDVNTLKPLAKKTGYGVVLGGAEKKPVMQYVNKGMEQEIKTLAQKQSDALQHGGFIHVYVDDELNVVVEPVLVANDLNQAQAIAAVNTPATRGRGIINLADGSFIPVDDTIIPRMPPVVGADVRMATGFGGNMRKIGRLYSRLILELPTNVLNRQPYFRGWYNRIRKGDLDLIDQLGIKFENPEDFQRVMGSIEQHAREFALQRTHRIMFDFTDQTRLAELASFVSPFMGPYQETFTVWPHLLANNPQLLAYANRLIDTGLSSGFLERDKQTKEIMVPLDWFYKIAPLVGVFNPALWGPTVWMEANRPRGVEAMHLSAPLAAFNVFFGSSFPVPIPGTGVDLPVPTPGLNPPLSILMQRLSQKLGWQRLETWAYQYGDSANIQSLLPSYLDNLITSIDPSYNPNGYQSYVDNFLQMYQYYGLEDQTIQKYRDKGYSEASAVRAANEEMIALAESDAKKLYRWKVGVSFLFPAAAGIEFPQQPLVDELDQLRAAYPFDRAKVEEIWLKRHPDQYLLLQSKTMWSDIDPKLPSDVKYPGIPSTLLANEILNTPGFKEFAAEFPAWAWSVLPQQAFTQGFDSHVFQQAIAKENISFLDTKDYLQRGQEGAFWSAWWLHRESWLAWKEAHPDVPQTSLEYQAKKAELFDKPVQQLRDRYPAGGLEADTFEAQGIDPAVIQYARALVQNKVFMDFPVGKALEEYLKGRDSLWQAMSTYGISNITDTAAEKLGFTKQYNDLLSNLSQKYGGDWDTAYRAFFSNDLKAVTSKADQEVDGLMGSPHGQEYLAWDQKNSALLQQIREAHTDEERSPLYTQQRQLVNEAYDKWGENNPAVLLFESNSQYKLQRTTATWFKPYIYLNRLEKEHVLGEQDSTAAEEAWINIESLRSEIIARNAVDPSFDSKAAYAAMNLYALQLAASDPLFAKQLEHSNTWAYAFWQYSGYENHAGPEGDAWKALHEYVISVQSWADANQLHGNIGTPQEKAAWNVVKRSLSDYVDTLAQWSPEFRDSWQYLENQSDNDLLDAFMPNIYFRLGDLNG